MSVSTGSFESRFSCSCSSDTNKAGQREGWAQEIIDRIHVSKDRTDVYLRKFVPSTTRCPLTDDFTDRDLFSDWTPTPGHEKDSYDPLVDAFTELVSTFPEDKRPAFFKAYRVQQQFPFSAFAKDHHKSYPDIAISFPGVKIESLEDKPKWSDIALTMEAKAVEADDPFDKDGIEHVNTQIQLAINARGLMHAHGFLCVFIIGVYGDTLRFIRFDHACAVVSKSLSLRNANHLKLIQRFFWRLVHPCDGGAIVGADPTVRKLNAEDRDWVAPRLLELGIDLKTFSWEEARRAEVPCMTPGLVDASDPDAFILLKALGVNGRLFSRSTTAWLGLRDTRRWIDGRLEDTDSEDGPASLQLTVVKEAWRQLIRQPESDFYDRLQMIDEDKRVGLPGLLCGGDLGEWEVKRWEASLYDDAAAENDIDHGSRLTTARTRAPDQPSTPTPILASLNVGDAPCPRPLHQTFTWRQLFHDKYWYRERSHMRLVLDTLGRPLSSFKSTKELVIAMRDAIKGHRAAMSGAGILHRDVSIGNILIVDDIVNKTSCGGFLHDFDFSTMSNIAPDTDLSALSVQALAQLLIGEDLGRDLKERTGTYYFMAINLLLVPPEGVVHTISHDLESFYWVLVWVVLRYTNYTHPSGDDTFLSVFPAVDDFKCSTSKMLWLKFGVTKLAFPGNQPLTDLMLKLSDVVLKHYLLDALDYDMILQCFDDVLAADQKWPENDKAVTRALPDVRTNSVIPAGNRAASSKKQRRQGGSKRKADEPPPEHAEGAVYYDDDADPVAARDDDTLQTVGVAQAGQGSNVHGADSKQPSKRRKTNSGNRSSRDQNAPSASSGSRMQASSSTGVRDVPASGPAAGTRSRGNKASKGAGSGHAAVGSRNGSGREGGSRARRTLGSSGSGKLR